jgi:X-X-X-Leu-X-X-Gly heptad repeat protein
MTAEIIAFSRPTQETKRRSALPVPFFATLPQPANSLTIDALPVVAHDAGDGVVAATIALSVACREMAKSLAVLIAHCESADAFMAELADGADIAADGSKAIADGTACINNDVAVAVNAVAKAARAATQA